MRSATTRASQGTGSPWLLCLAKDVSEAGEPIWRTSREGIDVQVIPGRFGLYTLVSTREGARFVVRSAFAPDGQAVTAVQEAEADSARFEVTSILGRLDVQVEVKGQERTVVRSLCGLTPDQTVCIPYWPRDFVPLGRSDAELAAKGRIHTSQRGPKSGLIYGEVQTPVPATFFYLQDFSRLNDYFEQSRTSPVDTVGGDWPELGFSLPPGGEPVAQGEHVNLSSVLLCVQSGLTESERDIGPEFNRLLAEVYLAMDKPTPEHRDWPDRIEDTLNDLYQSPDCSIGKDGARTLLPYVGQKDKPAESMVQLALVVPLHEYSQKSRQQLPLLDELLAAIPRFYDAEVGTMVRWLPDEVAKLKGNGEEHASPEVMDSWYLYHVLHNLARLAQMGHQGSHKLFVDSLDYAVDIARRFDYRWPVFFDLKKKTVIKKESEPGKGGEQDVGGLFALVMLLAEELTGDQNYWEEAVRGVQHLDGYGFDLAYQTNNTAFSASALARMWNRTGDPRYAKLGELCLANVLQHTWLWDCDYGYGKYYSTFFGIAPLATAPYLALFEELEILACLHDYSQQMGDNLSPALQILIPEFCKYTIDRCWYYYPDEIPVDSLAPKPKEGRIDRDLCVPLEDLYEGWQKAGQVGQEVYGAAAPFVFATRHCHLIPGAPFILHCDCPVRHLETRAAGRALGKAGQATLELLGSRICKAHVRLVQIGQQDLPSVKVAWKRDRQSHEVAGVVTQKGFLEYPIPADSTVTVTWRSGKPEEDRSKRKPLGKVTER